MKTLASILILACSAFAQLVIPPVTSECATSTDGSVVGTLNPQSPPVVAVAFSGTLGSGTYYIEFAWYDAAGHLTLASSEVAQQLISTGQLQISPPVTGMPATAVGMKVFIGTSSGTETLQGTTTGSATFIQSTALVSGAALPSSNATVCQLIANDAGWPTGTGYNVSLTTPAGATVPGYPLQAQFLGPGNTIDLSQGFPFYNGVVTYPVPLLARPYGHGPQSIAGPLDLTGYNLTSVNRLGIGTKVPGWGIDAEGSGINGAANANTGYLLNGAAPLNHVLLGNGSYYVDSATIPASSVSGLPTLYNQTIALNGVAQTQRPTLNFTSAFTATDSASPAETTIDILNSGVSPGTYAFPSSVTVNSKGQVSAITASTLGNFVIAGSAGQIIQMGTITPCNSPSCSATFAHTFTSTPTCVATGWGGSVDINTSSPPSTTTVTLDSSGVADATWMCMGAN